MPKAALGVDDFAKLRLAGTMFVDKSLFIRKFMLDPCQCNVLLRPRRFGKSLNLSMLRYFLSDSVDKVLRERIFSRLRITDSIDFCRREMGNYPVIYLCLKECHGTTWSRIRDRVIAQLEVAFGGFQDVLDIVLPSTRSCCDTIRDRLTGLNDVVLATMLSKVMRRIHMNTGKEVILLIDEYDAPLNSRMESEDDERRRKMFFADMYSDALKSNTSLHKACLVGVTEIRGAGILSGVNNLGIFALCDHVYDDCFGFNEFEVKRALNETLSLTVTECETEWNRPGGIKEWYNGYRFGNQELVNPWSFTLYVYNNRVFKRYWNATTSTNALFRLIADDKSFARPLICSLEHLLKRETTANGSSQYTKIRVNEFSSELNIRTNGTWQSDQAIHFLCMTGYLAYEDCGNNSGNVWIPNREIYDEWGSIVKQFVGFDALDYITDFFQQLIHAFETFDVDHIKTVISEKVAHIPRRSVNHEFVYQSFVCGMLSVFNCGDNWSLMETGAGRGFADSTLHFDNLNKSIIIEFKKADKESYLDRLSNDALRQIIEKRYFDSTSTRHEILLLGCAISLDNQVAIASATIGAGEQRDKDIKSIVDRLTARS